MLLLGGLLLALPLLGPLCAAYPARIPVQSFTNAGDREQGVSAVLNYTATRLNGDTQSPFLLAYSDRTLRKAPGDGWGVTEAGECPPPPPRTRPVCDSLEHGFMLMLVGDSHHFHSYADVANSMELPLINWDLSPPAPAFSAVTK